MTNEDRVFLDLLVSCPKYRVNGVELVNLADVFGGEEAEYALLEDLLYAAHKNGPRGHGGLHTDKSVV
jgi:hypothetical protein